MKLLTTPERMLLKQIYDRSSTFDSLVADNNFSIIDCFNILQRLIIKNLVIYDRGLYNVVPNAKNELSLLLGKISNSPLEVEQIIKSSLHTSENGLSMRQVHCSNFDLKILRHYFREIDRFINQLKDKKNEPLHPYYIFWGEQSASQHVEYLKTRYKNA